MKGRSAHGQGIALFPPYDVSCSGHCQPSTLPQYTTMPMAPLGWLYGTGGQVAFKLAMVIHQVFFLYGRVILSSRCWLFRLSHIFVSAISTASLKTADAYISPLKPSQYLPSSARLRVSMVFFFARTSCRYFSLKTRIRSPGFGGIVFIVGGMLEPDGLLRIADI